MTRLRILRPDSLKEEMTTTRIRTIATFASEICRRCDARFSCASYRAYAHAASQGAEVRFRQYFDDFGDDVEQGERIVAALTG